ncbi:hypothetical protein KJ865_00865, partial [Myxococcota bacterium]|nr:hypothetical protein [Myxococcota bacterium]
TLVVQVNGKLRDRINVPVAATKEEVQALVLASDKIQEQIAGLTMRKFIYIPNRLANVVAN